MISKEELRDRLLGLVDAEGLDEACQRSGVVGLANQLGIRVVMNFGQAGGSRQALMRFHPQPEILLFRKSPEPRALEVASGDEYRLLSHERFSVAHEIGHWLAFDRFGVEPIGGAASRSSAYWQHEEAVNLFAGRLLVARSRLAQMLTDFPAGVHLPTKALERMARQCRVSRIVMARQVAGCRQDFAYLELRLMADTKAPRLLLFVEDSAKSPDLALPGARAKVRNDRLVELFGGADAGEKFLPGVSFDGKRSHSLMASWSRISMGERAGGPAGRLVMTCWSRQDRGGLFGGLAP